MKLSLILLASAAPALALFNYTIAVGKDEVTGLPGVGFDPSRTVVQENGDFLVFNFLQGSHQVIQSSFAAPCSSNGGYDSGLQTVPNGTVTGGPSTAFVVQNISVPLYFYDSSNQNCLRGAVLCVNTNETSGSTTSCNAFKAAALALGSAQGVTTSVRSNSAYSQSTSSSSRSSSSARLTSTGTSASASATASKSAAVGASARGAGWFAGLVGLVAAVGVVA